MEIGRIEGKVKRWVRSESIMYVYKLAAKPEEEGMWIKIYDKPRRTGREYHTAMGAKRRTMRWDIDYLLGEYAFIIRRSY